MLQYAYGKSEKKNSPLPQPSVAGVISQLTEKSVFTLIAGGIIDISSQALSELPHSTLPSFCHYHRSVQWGDVW